MGLNDIISFVSVYAHTVQLYLLLVSIRLRLFVNLLFCNSLMKIINFMDSEIKFRLA